MTARELIYLQSVCSLDINSKADAFDEGKVYPGPSDLDEVDIICTSCLKSDTRVITINDPKYPDALKEIYAPPYALYTRGPVPEARLVAVSGTLRPDENSKRSAEIIGEGMAARGQGVLTLMHGGADSLVAERALLSGGSVTAVLDRGFGRSPAKNLSACRGSYAEISEYFPGMDCGGVNPRHAFRIASGMCSVLVMIDMPDRSALRYFAEEALEQGKRVFLLQTGGKIMRGQSVKRLVLEGASWFGNAADLLVEMDGILKSYY